jgi:SET and MYND domain-containing protein
VELKAIVRSRTDKLGSLQTIHKVQKMLVQLMNNTVAATNEPGKHKQFEDVKKMERDITALTREAIKDGDWPDHLDPIPLVRSTLARLYLNKREHLAALRNAMRGTLLCRYRNGPEWINNLCTLVQCLAAIAARNPDDTYFTSGGGFPTLKETQCAVRGYGMRLCKDAGAVFGGASQYTVFLCDWFSWVVKTAEPPGPGTAEFEDKFWEAQKKLLAWADVDIAYRVDLSSQLPCAENLANMFGKLSVEGGNETPEAVSDNKAGVDNEAEGDNKDAASGGSGDHKVSHWAGPSYYQGW